MKKILALLLLFPVIATAQTTPATKTQELMSFGVGGLLAEKIAAIGGELSSNSSSPINMYARGDAQRKFAFDGSSDTALTMKFGDGGTTAAQWLTMSAATADADDDSRVFIAGGGDASNAQGAYASFAGNEEATTPGAAQIVAGNVAGGKVQLRTIGAQDVEVETTNAVRWTFQADGDLANDGTNGGQLQLSKAGTTLALQEATAGSACMGTLTFNGATPVVTSTTCAATGARIFLTRTSAESTALNPYVSAISNGVSFSVTSEAGDTGTANWIIFKEAP